MSDMFEDEQPESKTKEPDRPQRSRAIWITLGAVLVLFLGFTGFASFWTDRLWFESIGYSSVFSGMIRTRVGLFLVFGLLMAAIVGLNIYLAHRFRPVFRPHSPEQVSLDRYRDAVDPIKTWLLIGVSLLVGAFAGTTASGNWRDYMMWRNGGDFDKTDPFFDRDIGFYVFDVPWLHFIVGFLMAATVIAALAAALVHYLYGGIRLQSKQDRLSGAAAVQLSTLIGIFVLAKAADYWLDRFDLLSESGSLMSGMGYTDDNAVLPAKNILMFIALICAILFFANIFRRTWLLPTVGAGLLVLSAVLLGMIWPGIVQQFQVEPSEADKEEPYLQKNIDATRAAYDIDEAVYTDYSGETSLTPRQQAQEADSMSGIRLVDPALVQATFEQIQQSTRYYSVAEVLDVDQYNIAGQERELVLGVRELNQEGLPEDSKNWSNLHTVYTHGYGVIAAYGNQRGKANQTQSSSGEPVWAEQDIPPKGELTNLFQGGYRPQIYFGENSPEYSIVGKEDEDDPDVELDLPAESEEGSRVNTYDGEAGVPVGNSFQQLLYAWKFREPNILLSGRVNSASKILYDRDPAQMVKKAAPWLTIDSDPFPAVVDGRVVWLLDGYTTTDRYPQAELQSYADMTDDSLDNDNQLRTLPTDQINYMRNAVKAVVDAYDGTVTLYAWDEDDPLLQAWRKAFPGTVKDKDEIPPDILDHMRYPEDLFKVQRYQLAAYHVEDARSFYEGNARWQVPEDPYTSGTLQPPYRLSVRTPSGGEEPVFSLTSVYVPNKKQNLAAFVSVDAEASEEGYGTLRVLTLPANRQIDGPGQIANTFGSNSAIQGELEALSKNSNVRLVNGNLLTLPVGEGLLYVQPLYAVRSGSSSANYPVLQYVLVSFGNKSGIGKTLAEAVANVLEIDADDIDPQADDPQNQGGQGNQGNQGNSGGGGQLSPDVVDLLRRADAQFQAAKDALSDGDFAKYGEATDRAEQLVQRALQLANQEAESSPDGGGDGSGEGSGGAGDGGGDQATDEG